MLAIAARFEIANDDWFYDPAVSGADPIEDATRLQRCISLTGDYLWERAATSPWTDSGPSILREVDSSWSRDRTFALCPS